MCFMIFQKEKPPLKTIKTVIQKSPKTGIFPKGIVKWFWSKIRNFPSFYFRQNRVKICFLVHFRKKKTPS